MIIIEEIIYSKVDDCPLPYKMYRKEHLNPLFDYDNNDEVKTVAIDYETIDPRCFTRVTDGESVFYRVGVSEQAQEVIGLMYEAWDTSEKMADTLKKKIDKEQKKYAFEREERASLEFRFNMVKTASFMTRLKWLFKGYA